MYKPAAIAGAFFAGLGVILGAFGAHALKEVLTAGELQTFETGVRYQLYHSFALLYTGLASGYIKAKAAKWVTALFIIGIVMFSGSLYLLTMLKMNGQVGLGGLGLLTPIGGLFFIMAWVALIINIIRK